ncbi:Bro-N domain-containing protein [Streptomyces sp. NPDC050263]|uniref:BRO-N domain-containing protein n=1 Tax=Streptomyces sp. NPDC050263 TaxID=3155037 RepID=UPI00343D7DDE
MYEQNNTLPPNKSAAQQDAIDINDFVFAATGARVRRLTMPDGEHWFPAMDVAKHLGYANTRDAVQSAVSQQHTTTFGDIARSVGVSDARRNTAGHGFRTTMRLVNLQGLIELVNNCMKPESQPFKTWVAGVIATIQRDGSYALEPAPVPPAPAGGTAHLMPHQVADAIVRLEVRNIEADEMPAASQKEQTFLLRQISASQDMIARSQNTIAKALVEIAQTLKSHQPEPKRTVKSHQPEPKRTVKSHQPGQKLTSQQLLADRQAKKLVFTEDIHAVAACLAPALVLGEAGCRIEVIATRTGLSEARVHDCLRTLLKRGCMRQTGCSADGAPVYVLP